MGMDVKYRFTLALYVDGDFDSNWMMALVPHRGRDGAVECVDGLIGEAGVVWLDS